jgi:hypothetical protein
MALCPNCGREVSPDWNHCPGCGQNLRGIMTFSQVVRGLVVTGVIFLIAFVVILGPLASAVIASNNPFLWVLFMYIPYIVIGVVSLLRSHLAFGLTLMIAGVIANTIFSGFVYGLIS